MATKKTLQRKKPGYTKAGVAKIVSLNTNELVAALDRESKKKIKAKISRRLQNLGYVAPVVELVVDGHGDVHEVVAE